jgi:hypothetical protein
VNTLALASSPYKGLVPYSEEDAQFFFGREAEREIITANLIASRLTLLYGASGVGKSSVLRAGVAHHLHMLAEENLREQGTPEFIVVVFNSWRDDPIASLTSRIHNSVTKVFNNQSIETLASSSSWTETLQAWTQRLDCDLLIILDQFEEYFVYHPQEDTSTFDTEFPRAVNRPDLRTNFLTSIREDALAKLDRFKGRIPSLFDNYLRLEHLGLDAARDAIVKPVEQYNFLNTNRSPIGVEPELVAAVLAQVKTGELILGEVGRGVTKASHAKAQVETPYLQLVMTRLWDEERDQNSRILRLETLNGLGGAKAIVSTHLDRVMGNLNKADQATAAVFFQYLVTPSGSKIAYPVSDLIAYTDRSEAEVELILKTLEKERVLRYIPPINQIGAVRYEIYHDVLARAILDWRSRFLQSQAKAEAKSRGRAETISTVIPLILAVVAAFTPQLMTLLENVDFYAILIGLAVAILTTFVVYAFFRRKQRS